MQLEEQWRLVERWHSFTNVGIRIFQRDTGAWKLRNNPFVFGTKFIQLNILVDVPMR